MTDCARLEEQLVELVDDLLDDAERAPLEAHLAECPACRTALEETRLLRAAYATLPEQDVSDEVAHALLAAARAEVEGGAHDRGAEVSRPRPLARPTWRRWPLAAAAAVLAGWLLWWLGEASPTPEELLLRGRELAAGGDLAGAEALYRRGLELDAAADDATSSGPSLAYWLGDALIEQQRYEEAYAVLDGLVREHPDDPYRDRARLRRVDALAAAGHLDEALAGYRQLAQDAPSLRADAQRAIESLQDAMPRLDVEGLEAMRSLGYIGR